MVIVNIKYWDGKESSHIFKTEEEANLFKSAADANKKIVKETKIISHIRKK